MDDRMQGAREKVAAAERNDYGRLVAIGLVVLWLATMLVVLGPAAVRGLF